ncbi:hypothetical protein [Modestobacter sp. Leaf380]|uniref:hypothetical protein n=1 Tax=Modestobacter sp. Leaf380 TaxID=1736356 RepID=UPI0006F55B65|nr:hypothetical protein [Modestobacter sp. Leaf380]KQS68235.1 hypothetical protein ASG41_04260 [Modestobacter sp. Leaf380]
MTITPEVLDDELSLSAAANRLSYLTRKDAEATSRNVVAVLPDEDDAAPPAVWADVHAQDTSLDSEEALELLALGEAISRKAHEHDSAAVLAARRAGADWADIGLALGVDPATAWDQHRDAFDDDELRGERPA